MFEQEIKQYDQLAQEYLERVAKPMGDMEFRKHSEIIFSCHSCGIEGNTFTVNDTKVLKEKGLDMIPQGRTLFEAFEILDHFRAYEEMVRTVEAPLTEEYVKHLHFLLTEHTISYRHKGAKPGEYTEFDMCAGETVFGEHEKLIARVPELLRSTLLALQDKRWHPMEVAARFHGHFEWLHPFRDGNGRIGRLLVNKLLLQNNLPILIIPVEQRPVYLECMKLFRENAEPLVDFFFNTAIVRMEREIEQKRIAGEELNSGLL